jgi:peptide/nickel transport system permease protein
MILTMFGICMVSFLVINLAPGDPADKTSAPGAGGGAENQGISDLTIRKNRERLFLDKPILFNFDPSDRNSVTAQMIEDLLSDDEYVVKDVLEKGRLNDLGTVAIHDIIFNLTILNRSQEIQTILKRNELKNKAFDRDDMTAFIKTFVPWEQLSPADHTALSSALSSPGVSDMGPLEAALKKNLAYSSEEVKALIAFCKDRMAQSPDQRQNATSLNGILSAQTKLEPVIIKYLIAALNGERPKDPKALTIAQNEIDEQHSIGAARRAAFLNAMKKISAPWGLDKSKDPRLVGSGSSRSQAWIAFHFKKQSDFSPKRADEVAAKLFKSWDDYKAKNAAGFASDSNPVNTFIRLGDKSLTELRFQLVYVGHYLVPTLMSNYLNSSNHKRVLAAWALSEVAKKDWDLIIDQEEKNSFNSDWERDADNIIKRVADISEDSKIAGLPQLPKSKGLSYTALIENLDKVAKAAAGKTNGAKVVKAVAVAARILEDNGSRKDFEASQTKRAFDDHKRKWKNWWERREECYVEFAGTTRFSRRFTDTRFGHWLSKLLVLDFGESYETNRPVMEEISKRFAVTFKMNFMSIFLTYLIAIPIGIYSATHQYSLGDRISTVLLFVLYSLPTFWVGTMMIWLLTGPPYLNWFPSNHAVSPDYATMTSWEGFWDSMWHLTLPVICLTYGGVAYISRQMRAGMLETVRQDYIRTARAKGLSESVVIYKHALRNSMIPIVTLLANLLPLMIGGSVIIEQIFSIEGLGNLSFRAVLNRDYPVIMAIFTFSGFLTLLGILLSDIMYALVDPRIKYS